MAIINKNTGEIIEIDRKKIRMGRMKRRVWAWANFLQKESEGASLWMITLTYKGVHDWQPNHIRNFMQAFRKMFGKKLIGYAWVAELQERGAVHYHVMVYLKGVKSLPHFDDLGLWSHGMTRVDRARTPFYIITYSGKSAQKTGRFPKGLRMFAVWLSPAAVAEHILYQFSLTAKPQWVKDIILQFDSLYSSRIRPKRVQGGGWDIADMLFRSPYLFSLGFRGASSQKAEG